MKCYDYNDWPNYEIKIEPFYEKMSLIAFPISFEPDHPALSKYQFRDLGDW